MPTEITNFSSLSEDLAQDQKIFVCIHCAKRVEKIFDFLYCEDCCEDKYKRKQYPREEIIYADD